MFSPSFVRFVFSLLFVSPLSVNADEPAPNGNSKDANSFGRLAEIFSAKEAPDIQGKAWVVIDNGPANWPMELEGWLIEEDGNEMLVLDWYGELHKLRRPKPKEDQPKVDDESTDFLGELQRADRSVAWTVRREDFHAKARKFLEDGLPKESDQKGVFKMVNDQSALDGHIVDAARYAHFAHHLGQKEQARRLYEHALETYKSTYRGGFEQSEDVPTFVANTIASWQRNYAIACGHDGTSRKELKAQWEKIAAIPFHEYREEAKEMAKHYGNLLQEDALWVEPDAKAFAEFTTDQKVNYWMYHLRDLDMGQTFFPGTCDVVNEFGLCRRVGGNGKPNPAAELKKLGMAAVPQLIAHMDDARPTRSKAAWRWYSPDGHYLLRYGDCCQQIFESISGVTIFQGKTTVSYPIKDGAAKQCKEKAKAWWLDGHRPAK